MADPRPCRSHASPARHQTPVRGIPEDRDAESHALALHELERFLMELNGPFSGEMTGRLIVELRRRGIGYLTGGHDPAAQAKAAAEPLDEAALLASLAAEPDARVSAACVALLLRHPELASRFPEALDQAEALAPGTRESLIVLCLAAAYLQQVMQEKLTFVLGEQHTLVLPSAFWGERNLPPPTPAMGEAGLEALNRYEQTRHDLPLEFQGDWRSAAEHLFKQEWLARQWPILQVRKVAPASPEEALLRRVAQAAEAWVQAQDPDTFTLTVQIVETMPQAAARCWQALVSVEPGIWRHLPVPQVFTQQWVVVRSKDGKDFQVEALREMER
jgi:hypothetical protein